MKLDERMTPKQGNRGSNALLTHGGALRFQYGVRAFKPRWRARESEQVRNFCTWWWVYECVRHAKYDLTADERTEGRWRRHLDIRAKTLLNSPLLYALYFDGQWTRDRRKTTTNNTEGFPPNFFLRSDGAQVAKPTCCCLLTKEEEEASLLISLFSDNVPPSALFFALWLLILALLFRSELKLSKISI